MTNPGPRAVYHIPTQEKACWLCLWSGMINEDRLCCDHNPLPEGVDDDDGVDDYGTCDHWESGND